MQGRRGSRERRSFCECTAFTQAASLVRTCNLEFTQSTPVALLAVLHTEHQLDGRRRGRGMRRHQCHAHALLLLRRLHCTIHSHLALCVCSIASSHTR